MSAREPLVIEVPNRLTHREAASIFLWKVLPFGASRLAFVVSSIVMASLLPKLGEMDPENAEAIEAAGPFLTSLQFLFMGPARGMAISVGLLVADAVGQSTQHLIGKISRQSWLMNGCTSAILITAFLNLGPIFSGLGIASEETAKQIGNYFRWYSVGVFPGLCVASDQQVAMRTGRDSYPLIMGITYSTLSMAFGVPLALGKISPHFSGVAGFSLGTSISAWLCFIVSRLAHFTSPHYRGMNLHQWDWSESSQYFKGMARIGGKIAFQVLTEWINLAAITSILGYGNDEASLEIQPSIVVSTSFALVSLGFTQALAGVIGQRLSASKKALAAANDKERDDKAHCEEAAEAHSANIKTIGNVGLIAGSVILTVGCCIAAPFSTGISKFFIGHKSTPAGIHRAANYLLINLIRTAVDILRNDLMGTLRGFKEVMAPAMLCATIMSAIGLPGSYLALRLSGVAAFFWTQTAMIAACDGFIARRWGQLSNLPAANQVRAFAGNSTKKAQSCLVFCKRRAPEASPIEATA